MGILPTARYTHLSDIPFEFLHEQDIRLVLLDMDNTLAPWHSNEVPQKFYPWVEAVKSKGITVAIFTNSKGSNADEIGKKLNIPVYKNAKKPFKGQAIKLFKEQNVEKENVLFVGDQLFTDIQLANSLNSKSVLTVPLESREWWCTKVFNRSRERLVWKFLFK